MTLGVVAATGLAGGLLAAVPLAIYFNLNRQAQSISGYVDEKTQRKYPGSFDTTFSNWATRIAETSTSMEDMLLTTLALYHHTAERCKNPLIEYRDLTLRRGWFNLLPNFSDQNINSQGLQSLLRNLNLLLDHWCSYKKEPDGFKPIFRSSEFDPNNQKFVTHLEKDIKPAYLRVINWLW
jgi:hypothetical protein